MTQIKQFYRLLTDNSELEVLVPGCVGVWKEDEEIFTKYFNENLKAIDEAELDLEFDEEDIY